MHITKSFFLAVVGLSAMAIADVATENEAARPAAFCESLANPERGECKKDRLEYCKRLSRDTQVRDACKRDEPWRGPSPFTGGGNSYIPGGSLDQECDLGRFEDLPNRCIRECRNSNAFSQPPWCVRHCAKYQRKGERGPDWCYTGGAPPPQYGQPQYGPPQYGPPGYGPPGPPGPPPYGPPGYGPPGRPF